MYGKHCHNKTSTNVNKTVTPTYREEKQRQWFHLDTQTRTEALQAAILVENHVTTNYVGCRVPLSVDRGVGPGIYLFFVGRIPQTEQLMV